MIHYHYWAALLKVLRTIMQIATIFYFSVCFMYLKVHYWLENPLENNSFLRGCKWFLLMSSFCTEKNSKAKRKLTRNKHITDHILEPLYSLRLTINLEKIKYVCLTSPGDRKRKKPACTYSQSLLWLQRWRFHRIQEILQYITIQSINEKIIIDTYMVVKLFGSQNRITFSNIIENTKAFVYLGYFHVLILTILEIKTENFTGAFINLWKITIINPITHSHK